MMSDRLRCGAKIYDKAKKEVKSKKQQFMRIRTSLAIDAINVNDNLRGFT